MLLGIDLGTTYSAVSYLDNDGNPQIILNREEEPTTPHQETTTAPTVSDPTPPTVATLHYAESAGVTEATLKADIAKALQIPEGTAIDVSGTYDLSTSGKYTLTCKWESGEGEVSVWVYADTVVCSPSRVNTT